MQSTHLASIRTVLAYVRTAIAVSAITTFVERQNTIPVAAVIIVSLAFVQHLLIVYTPEFDFKDILGNIVIPLIAVCCALFMILFRKRKS